MASQKRDLGVFMAPLIGLVITAGAILSIDESDPPLLTGARLLMAAFAAVMTVLALGFALRWNQPPPARPTRAPKPHSSATSSRAVSTWDGETTWGTGGIGGDMSVDTRLGEHSGMTHESAGSDTGGSWDYGGTDSGGSDSGGGGDSGGSNS